MKILFFTNHILKHIIVVRRGWIQVESTSIIKKENIVMRDSVESWQQSIEESSAPLIKNGYIKQSYVDAIFESTEKNGPYYVLAPEIAMPHASPQSGVLKQQISLLVLKQPIKFSDEGFDVRLVFTLAATDNQSHLDSLVRLADVFADEALIQKVVHAETVDEVYNLLHNKQEEE